MHFPSFLRLEYIKALWELFLFNMEKKKIISQVRDRDESKQIWNFRISSKKKQKKNPITKISLWIRSVLAPLQKELKEKNKNKERKHLSF